MRSYDPDKIPDLDPAAFKEADDLRLQPIHIICDEPGAKVGDIGGVSFMAFAASLPRAGEHIVLEDDTTCEVKRVSYKLSRRPDSNMVMLVPNVYAIRIGPARE